MGSASPAELRDWVEYCNFAGDSTLAGERRANGTDQAFNVKFWGVGNENWGCGGSMTPQYYADEFCRFRTFMFQYPGSDICAMACGPHGADWSWTRRFFEQLGTRRLNRFRDGRHGFAAHYYCGTAGTATEYTNQQWLELLAKARAIEGLVIGHRAIMDEHDPDRKVRLIFDEWGAWHPVQQGKPARGLYQQNTIRDACVAALTLDIFHKHADKVFMANIAQTINVLQAMLLTHEDQCIKTPTYHVFDLYQPHKGAQAVRLICGSETISDGGAVAEHCRRCYPDNSPFQLPAVSGSASVKDGVLCVTACNVHPTDQVELELTTVGGKLDQVKVVTLAADDIHAHNTFDQPDGVKLTDPQIAFAKGQSLRVRMPAGSVVRVTGKLG